MLDQRTNRNQSHKIINGLSALALWGGLLGFSPPASAQAVHKSIPLDVGGWFSGISVHSTGRVYGYGDVFGAWRSDNSGQSWTYLNRSFTTDDNFVSGLAVATGNADLVAFRSGKRLMKSGDGGVTWTAALADLTAISLVRGASPVMFYPGIDNEIWCAGNRTGLAGSLWRSVNGGIDWTKVGGTTFDSAVATTIYVRPEFPDQVWVGVKGAFYASADRGTSWTKVWDNGGLNNPFSNLPSVVMAVVRRADGIGYMAADVGGYRITAGNWADPATYSLTKTVSWWNGWGPTNATVLADGSFISGGNGDRNPDNFTDLRDAQRISADGGQTWQYLPLNFSTPPQPVWAAPAQPGQKAGGGRDFIVQDPTNLSRWFMTGGKAPVVSLDSGQNWTFLPNGGGVAGVMTYKVRFPRSAPNVALLPSSDKGAFVVTDGGAGEASGSSNRSILKLMTVHDVMSSDDAETLVAAGVDQNTNTSMIVRSTNAGATWAAVDLTSSGLPASSEGVTRSVMAPGNANDYLVLLGHGGSNSNPGMWRTTNGGASFTQATGLPAGMTTGSRYHQENAYLEVDGVNTATRYLAVRPSLFYRSVDHGASWTALAAPFGTDWVHGMAVDRATAGRVWVVGSYRGVKVSSDGGNTWASITGFTDAMRIDASSGRVVVWGKRTGDTWFKIYYSPDNGTSWVEKSGVNSRYAFTKDVAVDPWRAGQVWVSGISLNVIDGPATTPAGSGAGLKGEYFSDPAFTNLVKTQTDATINFDWGLGSPSNTNGTPMIGVGPDAFSVRWTGKLQAMESGTYTISVVADDAAKVWVGNLGSAPIIDQPVNNNGNPTSGTFTMQAGMKYDIKIDFTEATLGAAMKLFWTRPGGTSVVVPSSQLSSAAVSAPLPAPNAPTNLTATTVSRTQINLNWADNSVNEGGFAVEQSTDGLIWGQIATTAANATTFASTGLVRNKLYYFRVRAFNASGNSAFSNTASAKTLK